MANENAEVARLRQEAERVVGGTEELARIANQVLAGTKDQVRSLDDAIGRLR